MRIHAPEDCAGNRCCFHNPSDHHMAMWPLKVRSGPFDFYGKTRTGQPAFLTERTCPHGVGHPDPDSIAWLKREGVDGFEAHGCDGCCAAPPSLLEEREETERIK